MKTYSKILSIAALFLFTACSTQKQYSNHNPDKRQVTLEQIWLAQPQFNSAQADKIRITLNYAEREINANGTIQILTDSVIILSVQPLFGIELFRLELTPYNVTIIDKMNRRYTKTDYTQLQKMLGLPVTYYDIQALCIDHLCIIGHSNQDIKQLQPVVKKGEDGPELLFKTGKLHYTYTADANTACITKACLQPANSDEIFSVRYRNHKTTDNILFPETIEFSHTSRQSSSTCTIHLIRLQFNSEVHITPLRLERYNAVDIKTLLP